MKMNGTITERSLGPAALAGIPVVTSHRSRRRVDKFSMTSMCTTFDFLVVLAETKVNPYKQSSCPECARWYNLGPGPRAIVR